MLAQKSARQCAPHIAQPDIAELHRLSPSIPGASIELRILADELRADNIAVNELIPGFVRTEILTSVPSGLSEEWIKAPDTVVPLALFVASQPSPGPTGQSFSLMRRTY